MEESIEITNDFQQKKITNFEASEYSRGGDEGNKVLTGF